MLWLEHSLPLTACIDHKGCLGTVAWSGYIVIVYKHGDMGLFNMHILCFTFACISRRLTS